MLGSRWKKQPARTCIVEGGLEEVRRIVAASGADDVLFVGLSSVCLLQPGVVFSLPRSAGTRLVRFSVGRTPVEVFGARRSTAVGLLEEAPQFPPGTALRKALFAGVLARAAAASATAPGEVLLQHNLTQYYESNMRLALAPADAGPRLAARWLPTLADRGVESRVAEKGSVDSSWIASGVTVEGVVEHSVLFPGVVIGSGARVWRSVILSGNRVGAGADVQAAIVLPRTTDLPRPSLTIGEKCLIGNRGSSMRNGDYPGQIRGGIAVVGSDVQVPAGFRAEGATFIPPGTPAAFLRRIRTLRRGMTARAMPGDRR